VALSLENFKGNIIRAELVEAASGKTTQVFEGHFKGTHESPFQLRLPDVAPGTYTFRFTDDTGRRLAEKITIQ
jgi:hypothetical protein